MADEFFADLLPLKPKPGTQRAASEVRAEDGSVQTSTKSGSISGRVPDLSLPEEGVGDLLGRDIREEIPEDFAAGKSPAATPNTADKQTAQIEAIVQKSLHKFANGLQPVLLSMTRQLDNLGSKVDQVTSTLHASQTSSKQNDAIIEHLNSLEGSMRALKLSVEAIGKQQQVMEEHAKERGAASKQLPATETQQTADPPKQAETKVAAAELPSPAPSLMSNPSAVLPPGPPLPAPTVPPLPATAPPATPQEPPTPQRQPQTPAEAQSLQQYGSTASQQSFNQYTGHQQPRVQEQPVPQRQYSSPAPPQPPYGQNPQHNPQHGYPTNQQTPLAPPTPGLYNAPPRQPPSSQGAQQYSAPQGSQPYSTSYQQQPGSGYYSAPQESTPFRQQDTSPYSGSYGGPSNSRPGNYPSGGEGYPSVSNLPTPQPSMYGGGGGGGQTSFPPPPRPFGGHSYPPARQGPPKPAGQPSAQNVPMEQVIDDIANMGFSRHDARSAIQELQDKGQAVDLNVVLDRLMNGPRR